MTKGKAPWFILLFLSAYVLAPDVSSEQGSFEPSAKTIIGKWYIVATNPMYEGKIVTNYMIYTFKNNGRVSKFVRPGGTQRPRTEHGTFRFDPTTKRIITRFDLGDSGVQELSWAQSKPGEAKTVYWRNLTLGYEHTENDLFIKEGSSEWNARSTITFN